MLHTSIGSAVGNILELDFDASFSYVRKLGNMT